MSVEVTGVRLLDGPLGPWANAYPLGWPLPDDIIVFAVGGEVGVTTLDHECDALEAFGEAYRYHKVAESQIDGEHRNVLRGASYKFVFGILQ